MKRRPNLCAVPSHQRAIPACRAICITGPRSPAAPAVSLANILAGFSLRPWLPKPARHRPAGQHAGQSTNEPNHPPRAPAKPIPSSTALSRTGLPELAGSAAMAMVEREAADGQPLSVEELLTLLRGRWQASYDLQLVRRQARLYLHVMWGHLEQQSFPLTAEAYGEKLEGIVTSLNGLGVAAQVRHWLTTTRDRPRLGKALSLPLQLPEGRASEFLL